MKRSIITKDLQRKPHASTPFHSGYHHTDEVIAECWRSGGPPHLLSCAPPHLHPHLWDLASFSFCIFNVFCPTSFFHSACKQALDHFTPSSTSFLLSHPLLLFLLFSFFAKCSPSWLLKHHIPLGYRILTDLCFLFELFSVFLRFYSFSSFAYRSLNFSCYAN